MTEPREAAHWDASAVEALAHALYGITGRVRPLPSEYDQVFELTALDGSMFILKVMHPEREASFVDLQCRTLQHLAWRAPSLRLARVIPTVDGAAFQTTSGADGSERIVWLLSHVPGKVLFDVHPHSAALLAAIGGFLGSLDHALADFNHPSARRQLKWDLSAPLWIHDALDAIEDPGRHELITRVIKRYVAGVVPLLPQLRRGVIYGDANDYNVLVEATDATSPPRVGLIDFGDMHEGMLVAEPAVAAAYALLGKDEPLVAMATLVSGYHRQFPLETNELGVLFPLTAMRLAVSVVNSALRHATRPDDSYVTISEAPAWAALDLLDRIHPRRAEAVLRQACGLAPLPDADAFAAWLRTQRGECHTIVDVDLRPASLRVLDLGVGSSMLGADPAHDTPTERMRLIAAELARSGAAVGIGRHDEARHAADAVHSIGQDDPVAALRTIHLGVELFLREASAVHAPLAATVYAVLHNGTSGTRVILRHEPDGAPAFFTLFQPLDAASVGTLAPGQQVAAGEIVGRMQPADAAMGGISRLHFQLARDLLDSSADFPERIPVAERAAWNALSPDPNLLLGIPAACFPQEASSAETLARRQVLLGPSLSLSYGRPLKVVRGWRQYLYDDMGRPYLDMFNNVPLVGHNHPRVVEAACRQLALLNTNTRYLHDTVLRYAERLTALLPAPLHVCYFVNSGSEANELAIRLARTHTHAQDMLVLENAYHGNTGTVTDISPYKFNGPGGSGRKPWVHIAPIADDYRGPHRRGEADLGGRYAEDVKAILGSLHAERRHLAAFIAESMPSVGGQIIFPDGYLAAVYALVRAAGGLCIADEVQVGFGRLGSAYWGFETQGVVPDIVVLAKPIGNCFPLAAVVTTPAIAASFHNGMEFFSTYGGNPVACAAGLAVLDVLRDEALPEHALRVGNRLLTELRGLQARHALIGDVRGMGLFQGIDLVTDRDSRQPATAQAGHIVERLRDRGVLAGTDGPFHNVVKLRPPLVIADADVDRFVGVLDSVLSEDLPA
jgi:4-aminobutyrate aminotransferase-like enzyme/Ser/Thr protein kinase RdoA (MazF antagonist)